MAGGWYLKLISEGSDHRPEPEPTRFNRNPGKYISNFRLKALKRKY